MRTPWRRGLAACALAAFLAAAAAAEDGAVLVQRLDADDAAARAAALEALRAAPDRDAIVVRALRVPDERARLGPLAAETLARLAGELALSDANVGLRAILKDAATPIAARKAAALALARTGSVADVTVLGDAVPVIPEEAARALAAIGGRSAELALRRGGGEDPPLAVRAGLARLGDRTQEEKLLDALDGPDREHAGALLRWVTGRDLPADRNAWFQHFQRASTVESLADLDNDAAGTYAASLAEEARRDPARVADLVAILRDEKWPPTARDKAALALGLAGARAAQADLLWACRDGEVGSVRIYAADALARVGDLSCAPALVAMLNNDEDKDRIAARRSNREEFFPVDPAFVRALFRMGCKGPATRLIDLLAGEYRTRLHRDCLRALAEVSGERDFGYEADAAKPERVAGVQRIRAWWREARAAVPLAPRSDDPGWPAFREAVAANVEKLGEFKFLYQMRAKNFLIDLAEPARPQIEAGLAHADDHVRMGCADVLAAAGLRESADALAARLAAETKPAVRSRLVLALEVCGRPWPDGRPAGSPRVADAIRSALTSDASLTVRIAAARALGAAGESSKDAVLLETARASPENADPAFALAASSSLLRLARRAALPDVVRALRSEDVALRAEAARALATAGFDLRGYDPDLPPEAREAAIQRIAEAHAAGELSVPYRERK